MDGRQEARMAIEASRLRLTTIAEELARRASMGYVKERAKSAAITRTRQLARPLVSPWMLGIAATVVGTLAFVRWGGERGERAGRVLCRVWRRSSRIAGRGASVAAKGARLAGAGTRELARTYAAVEDARRDPSDRWLAIASVVFTALVGGIAALRAARRA